MRPSASPAVRLALALALLALPGVCKALEKQAFGPIPLAQHLALDKAASLLEEGLPQEAADLLERTRERALAEKPGVHPLVLFNLGNTYLALDRPDKALSVYETCVGKAPSFSLAWLNLAKTCFDLSRFQTAGEAMLKGYETSLEKNPDHLYYAAAAFLSGKDPARALGVLENLLGSQPPPGVKNSWVEALVHVHLSMENPEKALPHIQYLTRNTLGEEKERWQETLLHQYMTLGMKKEALAYVTQLTNQYPEQPRWWKGMAHFQLGENNYTAALTAMTVYGYLTELTETERRLTADLCLTVGIPARALVLYEDLYRKTPSPELIEKIIQSLEQMNQTRRALAWADQGCGTFPENRDLALLRGDLLFSLKAYGDAAAAFQALTDRDDTGKAWLMLGYSAWNGGDLATARRAMEKAASHDTHAQAARKALEQMSRRNR
jgi:tetratricopeptide (TPR) repeat protein